MIFAFKEPLPSPKHFIPEMIEIESTKSAGGAISVTVAVFEQPFASVAVQEYMPPPRFVMLEVVPATVHLKVKPPEPPEAVA